MTAACLAFAAVVYAPLAALTWTSALPSAKVLAAVAGLAVICTAVAFLLFFRLIAEVGPARASVITYINPAVAVEVRHARQAVEDSAVLLMVSNTAQTRHPDPGPAVHRSGDSAYTNPACARRQRGTKNRRSGR